MRANNTKEARDEWRTTCDGRRALQEDRAERLVCDAGDILPRRGGGFRETEMFQMYCAEREVAIVVFGEPAFFDGRGTIAIETIGVINLCHDPELNHFDTILNLFAVGGKIFLCSFCNKCYAHIDQHRCKSICPSSFVAPPCKIEGMVKVKCEQCHRNFFGDERFENHKKDGSYKKKE